MLLCESCRKDQDLAHGRTMYQDRRIPKNHRAAHEPHKTQDIEHVSHSVIAPVQTLTLVHGMDQGPTSAWRLCWTCGPILDAKSPLFAITISHLGSRVWGRRRSARNDLISNLFSSTGILYLTLLSFPRYSCLSIFSSSSAHRVVSYIVTCFLPPAPTTFVLIY